jgi:hypothetical protein
MPITSSRWLLLWTNEKGIAELGDDRMAWFKDPDGNVHGVGQA